MRHFATAIHCCILLLLCTAVAAQVPTDTIDKFVESQMQKQRIPGLALLIARHGKVVRAQGYGFSNLEHQVQVKPETIFQSGSVGKQFTATAVMMLVEEGKVRLDDPLSRYFNNAPPAWTQVTVRQLLSHTAGFGDYPESFDMRRDWTEEELLKFIQGSPLAFPPGTKFAYSNMGYVTLGILIHRVTGMFYGDFLQQRIFKPLGMSTTRIINEADIIPNRAAGYRLVNGEVKNQEWVSPALNTTADGSLYFSVLDLAKWDAALDGEKLLKRSSLNQMWTPARLNDGQSNSGQYGFGWFVRDAEGHKIVEHVGEWQGFTAAISRYLDDGLTVVVLTNLAHADPQEIVRGVAARFMPGLKQPTKPAR